MKKPFESKAKRLYSIFASVFFMLAVFVVPAFAADGDPLAVVNNLSDFIFSLIRAVGLILLGFGILQVGLSLKSHDPSQRANGILTVAGGIVPCAASDIVLAAISRNPSDLFPRATSGCDRRPSSVRFFTSSPTLILPSCRQRA